jgi:hypothetical protein
MHDKQCKACKEVKSLSEFRHAKDRKGLMQARNQCKTCERKASLEYETLNREKRRQEKRDFYQNNLEKELQRKKDAYARNTEKEKARSARWRDKNREYLREKDRQDAKERPAYFCYKTQKRHAAKLQRTPKWLTAEQLKDIQTEYELSAWCSKVMGIKYNVDHIVPLQGKTVCGLHVPWNLRVIPASDNFKKSNKFHDH